MDATVFRLALYYGIAGFGGGYSVLAQVRRDLVVRRRLVSEEDFLVLAELSKSLPGTPATNLLALLGQRVGGVRGGLLAACAFLLPSTVLMIGAAAAYSLVRAATGASLFLDGMNAAMVGIVAAVTVDLGRSALRSKADVLLATLSAVLLVARVVVEPVLAVAAVAVGAIRGSVRSPKAPIESDVGGRGPGSGTERLHGLSLLVALPLVLTSSVGALAALVRVFAPIGVMTFGGGLAMIPAIDHMVVAEQRWLDTRTFADAIALGQITPGPVAICATFVGYRVAGVLGALVATFAMFAPATVLALTAGHYAARFRTSPVAQAILRMLAPAVIGMLAAATFSLGRASLSNPGDAVLAIACFFLLVRRPMSPLWVLVGSGLLRAFVHSAVVR
jgi:chromate transporter